MYYRKQKALYPEIIYIGLSGWSGSSSIFLRRLKVQSIQISGTGYRVLGTGIWDLGSGIWGTTTTRVLGFGIWLVACGLWLVSFMFRVLIVRSLVLGLWSFGVSFLS